MSKQAVADEFVTDDLDLASWLQSEGFSPPRIQADATCGRKRFFFPGEARTHAELFAESACARFSRARRELCWRLHRV